MITSLCSYASKRPPLWWGHLFLLMAAIIFPSLALFKKPGFQWLIVYLLLSVTGLLVYFLFLHERIQRRMTGFNSHGIFITVMLFLLAAHTFIYPLIDTDGFHLLGIQFGASDSDNAIEDCLRALINGKYPYYETTFLGNPMTPMPGALLLAAPFYFIHHVAWQNFFWILVFYFMLARHLKSAASAALIMVVTLAVSPNIIYHLMHGGDYLANGIYVFVALFYAFRAMQGRNMDRLVAAMLLGVALSSRLNYVVCLPVAFLAMVRAGGWMRALSTVTAAGLITGLLTLPFYLYDPAGFSPLHTTTIASRDSFLPHASVLIPLIGLLASLVMAARPERNGFVSMSRKIYLLQFALLLLVMTGVMIADVSNRGFMQFPHFSLLFTFFGIYGFSGILCGRSAVNP